MNEISKKICKFNLTFRKALLTVATAVICCMAIEVSAQTINFQVLTCHDNTAIDVVKRETTLNCSSTTPMITITQPPQHGTGVVMGDSIVYYPDADYVGADVLKYSVTCGSTVNRTLNITVVECPDNVKKEKCFGDVESINWNYKKLMETSQSYVVSHMSIPLVGDIDNDGKIEIIVPKEAQGGSSGTVFSNVLYIFDVNGDANTISLQQTLNTPYFNVMNNSYAIANVDGGKYSAIFLCTSLTLNSGASRLRLVKYTYNGTNYGQGTNYPNSFSVEYLSPSTSNADLWETPQPMIVDFNGDGIPEVVVYDRVFNARNGTLLVNAGFRGNSNYGFGIGGHIVSGCGNWWSPYVAPTNASMMVIADIDNDGVPEVIGGNCVYKVNITNPNGTSGNTFTLFSRVTATNTGRNEVRDGATAVADMTGDGFLDVIVTTVPATGNNSALYIWNPRATASQAILNSNAITNIPRWTEPATGSPNNRVAAPYGCSVPFVGDIDGDGMPEICLTGKQVMRAYNYNPSNKQLTQKWSRVTTDASGATTMVMFDFDQDGKNELVYRDQTNLRIINGVDGYDKVTTTILCYSETSNEYPVVADINGDGSAEIIVTGSPNAAYKTNTRVMIFSSKEEQGWAPARKVWNQFSYNVVNVNDDLTIPKYQMNPATYFPNGEQPFNGYLKQQTTLNKEGDKFWPIPDIALASEPTATQDGNSIVFEVCVVNKGLAPLLSELYITVYKNEIDTKNIIHMDSELQHIYPDEDYCFSFTLNNLSNYMPLNSIWIRVNDKLGDFPFYYQCELDVFREFKFCTESLVMPTLSGDEICDGEMFTIDFSPNPADTTVYWSVESVTNVSGITAAPETFTAGLPIGGNLTAVNLANSAFAGEIVYNVYFTSNETYCYSDTTSTIISITPRVAASDITIGGTAVCCSGETATLTPFTTIKNATFYWYESQTATEPFCTGNSYTTSSLSIDTTLYIGVSGDGYCVNATNNRIPVTVSVTERAAAGDITIAGTTICAGETATLTPATERENATFYWYESQTATMPFYTGNSYTTSALITDTILYIGVSGDDCCVNETNNRAPVTVSVMQLPEPPSVTLPQITCGKTLYLTDVTVTGVDIKWYAEPTGDNQITSPATTEIISGTSYYVAQTVGMCESERIAINIVSECYEPYGTVFPFVHTGDFEYDNLFVTTAKLYEMPPRDVFDKVGYIRRQKPLHTVRVEYYDCDKDFIAEAPKYPGVIGNTNNPGLPINWAMLGYTSATPNSDVIAGRHDCPTADIGKYTFTNVVPGDYVLEIARAGFLPRYGKITIASNAYLGHRELLAGDDNGDLIINEKDLSAIRPKLVPYGISVYDARYEFNGDMEVNNVETEIIRVNLGAIVTIYQETAELY